MHLILALIALGLLVFFHEFGHFIAARWAGVTVQSFAVGFGPALLKKVRGDTEYRINIIPFGGYCKMLGEDEALDPQEGETAPDNDERNFNNKSVFQRMVIISSGVFMNFFIAFLAFMIIAGTAGVPRVLVQIEDVEPGGPAENAGLRPGDYIVQVEGEELAQGNELVDVISRNPGEEISILVERNSEEKKLEVIPEQRLVNDEQQGWIGVTLMARQDFVDKIRNPVSLIAHGVQQTSEMSIVVIDSYYQLFSGQVSFEHVTGPVGMVQFSSQVAATGIINLMFFTAFISINLALINLFPFPALDGGRLVFLIIEAFRGKAIPPHKEGMVHWIGFMVLILLIIYVTLWDVIRIF